jgi:hypothetical protein
MSEARTRYDRGLALFNDHNYEGARVEFARANQLAPSNRILYNIGVCDAQLNDYVAAISNLEKYLKQGGLDVPDDRRAEVERLLAQLRPRTGRIVVTSNVQGATVSIDDINMCEERGICTTPMQTPMVVNPGRRRVTVSKAGWITRTQSLVVAGSETKNIDIILQPTTVTKNVNVLPYVMWGATVLLAAGAGVTGAIALKASSDEKNLDNTLGVSDSELNSTRNRMRTFGVTADILTGCAVAAGGTALYLTIKPNKDSAGAMHAGVGPGALLLGASF